MYVVNGSKHGVRSSVYFEGLGDAVRYARSCEFITRIMRTDEPYGGMCSQKRDGVRSFYHYQHGTANKLDFGNIIAYRQYWNDYATSSGDIAAAECGIISWGNEFRSNLLPVIERTRARHTRRHRAQNEALYLSRWLQH